MLAVVILGTTLLSTVALAEPVTIEYFVLANNEELAAVKKVVAAFEKEYPNIRVNLNWVPTDSYYDKLRVRIAAGDIPDMMRIVIEEYQGLAARGVFLDLTPYIERDKNNTDFARQWDDYIDIVLDAFKYKGRMYGMPIDWNDAIIFYNEKLFDEAGIPYPDEHWDNDEFLSIAKKLTKVSSGGRVDQYGYLITGDWFDSIAPWVFSFGGNILSDDWSEVEINSPEGIAAIQWLHDLVREHKVSPPRTALQEMGAAQMFMTGRVAMGHYGRYMLPAFQQIKAFDFDIQHHPYGPKGTRGVPYGAGALCIGATTKYPEECWIFAKYISGPKGQAIMNELRNSIPVLNSIVQTDEFKNPSYNPKHQWRLIEAVEYARLIPSPPGNAELIKIAQFEIDKVLLGVQSAAEAAENIKVKGDAALKEALK